MLSEASPRIDTVCVAVYTVPTDALEADGTLEWDSTTMILMQVEAGGRIGLGWTYGQPACADYITGKLAAIVKGTDPLDVGGIDGALDPGGGAVTPDVDAPGLGLTLREHDVERFRV
ncbi:hypothetical protein [Tomitella biformata]|uniref:hypothetical protein n=1 Tax=Tomitella biformata TaxID=630403 RepID=UPI000467C824